MINMRIYIGKRKVQVGMECPEELRKECTQKKLCIRENFTKCFTCDDCKEEGILDSELEPYRLCPHCFNVIRRKHKSLFNKIKEDAMIRKVAHEL